MTTFPSMVVTGTSRPAISDPVALSDPVPGEGEQLFDVSSSGVNYADTHHCRS